MIAGGAQENGAEVGDLGGDHRPGKVERGVGIVRQAVLRTAEQHIAGGKTGDRRQESAVAGQHGKADARFGAGSLEKGAGGHSAEGGDAIELMERDAEGGFIFDPHRHRFAIFLEVRALGLDKQSIKVSFHRASSDAARASAKTLPAVRRG